MMGKSEWSKIMKIDTESPFLTPAEAAIFLRLDVRSLDNMRWKGTGPRFRKHGNRVFYHEDDLRFYSSNNDCGSGPKLPEEKDLGFG